MYARGHLLRSPSWLQSLVLIGSELVCANNYLQLRPPLCMTDVSDLRAGEETDGAYVCACMVFRQNTFSSVYF